MRHFNRIKWGAIFVAAMLTPAFGQNLPPVETSKVTTVYGGPGKNFGAVTTLQPNEKLIIIPPKSVIIGKGVTIGQGVLIEGKPWHNVILPNGEKGYVSGSLICSRTALVAGTAGLCVGQGN